MSHEYMMCKGCRKPVMEHYMAHTSSGSFCASCYKKNKEEIEAAQRIADAKDMPVKKLVFFKNTVLASPDTLHCSLHAEPRSFEWCEENCPKYYSCDTIAMANDEVKLFEGEAWECSSCGNIVNNDEDCGCGVRKPKESDPASASKPRERDFAFGSDENQERNIILALINDSTGHRTGLRYLRREDNTVHDIKVPAAATFWNANINPGLDTPYKIVPKCCNLSDFPILNVASDVAGAPQKVSNAGAWVFGAYPDGRLRLVSVSGHFKDVTHETAVGFHVKYKLANAELTDAGQLKGKSAEFPVITDGSNDTDLFYADNDTGIIVWERQGKPDLCFYPFDVTETALDNKTAKAFFDFLESNLSGKVKRPQATALLTEGKTQASMEKILAFAKNQGNVSFSGGANPLNSGNAPAGEAKDVLCKDCGEVVDPDAYNTFYIESINGYVCRHCRDNYSTCVACGSLYRTEEMSPDPKCSGCSRNPADVLDDVFYLQDNGRVEWMYFNQEGYGGEGQYVSNIFYPTDIQAALTGLKNGDVARFFDNIGSYAKQYITDCDGSAEFKEEERRFQETQWDLQGCTERTMQALIAFTAKVASSEREAARSDVFHVRTADNSTRKQIEWSYQAENTDIIVNWLTSAHVLQAARNDASGHTVMFFADLEMLAKKDRQAHQLIIKRGDDEYGAALQNLFSSTALAKGRTEQTKNALINTARELELKTSAPPPNVDRFFWDKEKRELEWVYFAHPQKRTDRSAWYNEGHYVRCVFDTQLVLKANESAGKDTREFFELLHGASGAKQVGINDIDFATIDFRFRNASAICEGNPNDVTRQALVNAVRGLLGGDYKPSAGAIDYEIYQITDRLGDTARKYRFESYGKLQAAGLFIDAKNYDAVYSGTLHESDKDACLNQIFEIFNERHPADYKARSVSVSDVLVLSCGGEKSAHYVDSAGFVEVPEFFDAGQTNGNKVTAQSKTADLSSDIEAMKALNAELIEACNSYYTKDDSPLSDYEYDKKFDELRAMEAKTGVILPDSVTQDVGASVVASKLPKVTHESKLLSLEKTKEVDVLIALLKTNPEEDVGVLAWKMDGLTIEATYNGGVLKQAVTRGNGKVGEDVIHNARFFRGMPKRILYTGKVRVRGEAVISYPTFERINASLPEGQEPYKTPRNLASGTVRRPKATKDGSVEFLAFQVTFADASERISTYSGELNWLRAQGFTPVHHYKCNSGNVQEYVSKFKEIITKKGFDKPTDGLVLTLDSVALHDQLGTTGRHPKYALAFKWEDAKEKTNIRHIKWSVSRTGVITPVAVFDAVELEGTTVKQASVFNVTRLRALKLGIGDEVSVYKANMIIPQIAENHTKSDTCMPPKECPVCGALTEIRKSDEDGSEFLYCVNAECIAKNIRELAHFVKRDAMNIEGVGQESIAELVSEGFIRKSIDFYTNVSQHPELAELPGWGKKSYNKLLYAIENSRKVRLAQLIYALGIRNVGRTASDAIANHFKSIFTFMDAATDTRPGVANDLLGQVEGVGELMQADIIAYFKDKRAEVEALIAELDIQNPGSSAAGTAPKGVAQGAPNCLKGLSFCITGKVEFPGKRTGLQQYISDLGGKNTSSVSRGVNYLITNDPDSGSKKNKDAQTLGCKVISEDSFIRLVQQLSANSQPDSGISSEEYDARDYAVLSVADRDAERAWNKKHNWELSEEALVEIIEQHTAARDNNDYRKMLLLEYRLDDLNFHDECEMLHNNAYNEALKHYRESAAVLTIKEERPQTVAETNFQRKLDAIEVPEDERDARIQTAEAIQVLSGKPLAGLTICVTGKVHYGDRGSFENYVRSLGGNTARAVTRKVDYLVTNTPNSGSVKNRVALENGCRVISESEFMKLARGESDFKFMSTTTTQTENVVERDPYFSQIPEKPVSPSDVRSGDISGIAGKTFCITGRVLFPGKRAALERFISANGGFNASKVDYGVDYLITNDPTSGSTKNRAAKSMGCKVISEAEFMRMANARVKY